MAVKITCSSCDNSFAVKDNLAGKRVRCPACKHALEVPAEDNEPPTPADAGGPFASAQRPAVVKKATKNPLVVYVLCTAALAAVLALLFVGASVFALVNHSKVQHLQDAVTAAEQKTQDAITETQRLKERLAATQLKGQVPAAGDENLKKELDAARKAAQEATEKAEGLDKRLDEQLAKNEELTKRLSKFTAPLPKVDEDELKRIEADLRGVQSKPGVVVVVQDSKGNYRAFAAMAMKKVGRLGAFSTYVTLTAGTPVAVGTGKGTPVEIASALAKAVGAKGPYFVVSQGKDKDKYLVFNIDKEEVYRSLAGGPDAIASGTIERVDRDVSISVKAVVSSVTR